MIKYCIFDLDGTLLNTLTSIRYFLNASLLRFGFPEITLDECRSFIGNGARILVCRALAARGVTDNDAIESVLSDFKATYDERPYYLTEPYPDIIKVIDELLANGITLGVLSNKPDSALKSVVRSFFGDRFAFISGGRENIPLKPDPTACLAMLGDMAALPEELAFIGDSDVDIETAKRVGAALSIGVSWGFRDRGELLLAGADKIADTAYDILKYVGVK